MKKLRTYDDYEKSHLQESFLDYKFSTLPDSVHSDQNTKDIEDNDEEVEDSSPAPEEVCDTEECENLPVLASGTVATTIEISVEPSENQTPVNSIDTPKVFSVVRIMTQNGEKIGMCYMEDASEYGASIQDNLDFNSACAAVKQQCSDLGFSEFEASYDNIIGAIPSFMIPKKSKPSSYKPIG